MSKAKADEGALRARSPRRCRICKTTRVPMMWRTVMWRDDERIQDWICRSDAGCTRRLDALVARV